MKCKYCNGTGKSKYGYNQPCTHCDGKGFAEPLTNDEWRRTCSTEDFASWLMKHFSRDDIIVLWVKYKYPTSETADGLKCADYKEAIRRWLKEKHSG